MVDARVIVVGVRANPDPFDYDAREEEEASHCVPDADYMRDNPVRYELYHFQQGRARLTRRLLGTWFSDNDRVAGGIEVRVVPIPLHKLTVFFNFRQTLV